MIDLLNDMEPHASSKLIDPFKCFQMQSYTKKGAFARNRPIKARMRVFYCCFYTNFT